MTSPSTRPTRFAGCGMAVVASAGTTEIVLDHKPTTAVTTVTAAGMGRGTRPRSEP